MAAAKESCVSRSGVESYATIGFATHGIWPPRGMVGPRAWRIVIDRCFFDLEFSKVRFQLRVKVKFAIALDADAALRFQANNNSNTSHKADQSTNRFVLSDEIKSRTFFSFDKHLNQQLQIPP
jgi:hypothetical protein